MTLDQFAWFISGVGTGGWILYLLMMWTMVRPLRKLIDDYDALVRALNNENNRKWTWINTKYQGPQEEYDEPS